MNPQFRRFVIPTAVGFLFLISILLSANYYRPLGQYIPHGFQSLEDEPHITSSSPYREAANATLGFQKIFTVTTGTPWRLNGLRAAAELTGLKIDYPIQPHSPPELVEAFEHIGPEDGKHPLHGAALAWMAHIDLIKHVIQGGWSSAWIIEDDVDWDTALRDEIMIPIAEGVRNYTNADPDDMRTPFGGNFDLLWIGHCGEWSHDDMPYHGWPDRTVIPHSEYVGWAKVDMVRLPEGERTTHPTTNSVCTFAYGVTAEGARKVLEHVGAGHEEAYDVALSNACLAKKLHCVTIHPEVFHQYEPPSTSGDTSEIDVGNRHGEVHAAHPAETEMGTTPNVRNSARCKALFDTTCQKFP